MVLYPDWVRVGFLPEAPAASFPKGGIIVCFLGKWIFTAWMRRYRYRAHRHIPSDHAAVKIVLAMVAMACFYFGTQVLSQP